jgi:hypothetical protein
MRERDIHGDIGHVQVVVGEVLLDHVTLEAEADDELVHAEGRVDLHDVPQDRLASDLHHRLGSAVRFFREACAQAAGQHDGLFYYRSSDGFCSHRRYSI